MHQSTEKEQSDKSNLQNYTNEADRVTCGRTGILQIKNTPFYVLEEPLNYYITFKNYKILGPFPKEEGALYEEDMMQMANTLLEIHHWNVTTMIQTIIAEDITREILKETTTN